MDYYQELGVPRDAPIEEIRRAYKIAARLLHPDNQPDTQLRRMAEIQMTRLNEVLAVLSHPYTRREYDETLEFKPFRIAAVVPPQGDWRPRFHLRQWYWVAIGMIATTIAFWWVRQPDPSANAGPQERAEAPQTPNASGESKPEVPRKHTHRVSNSKQNRQTKPIRALDPAPVEPLTPVEPLHQDAASDGSAQLSAGGAHPRVSTMSTFPVEKGPLGSGTSMEGSWVFVPADRGKSDAELYPPVFIEFRLGREKGALAGSYMGRYRIRDRALDPVIRLRMQEESHTETIARMSWNSEDGAAGKAELVLTQNDQLKVEWWTTVFGRRNTLTSGTAVLTRWEQR